MRRTLNIIFTIITVTLSKQLGLFIEFLRCNHISCNFQLPNSIAPETSVVLLQVSALCFPNPLMDSRGAFKFKEQSLESCVLVVRTK